MDHEPQRRRRHALPSSDVLYRHLFESIDEGFCIIEVLFDDHGTPRDYRFLEVNPAFETHTGLRDAVGKRMLELEPRHEQHWFEMYGRIALTGHPERFTHEAKYLHERWYDVYALRIGPPSARMVAILFRDISARKRVEQALRASEERFRALVNASSEIVYRMGPDWTEMYALDGRGFMADTQDRRAGWLDHYIHPDDQPLVTKTIAEAIENKSAFELEHRVRRVDGTFGWMLSRAVPILDENGQITEWFGAANDVTARKEAERTLRDAARAKDEFLAVLGHELRNPLAPMSMGVALLEKARSQPALIDTIAPMMKRQLDHLTHLVDDLLDVSRLTRGHAALQCAPLDLRAAAEAAIEQCQPLIDERRHALEVQLPQESIPVHGDFQRLTQVLGNLLINAARYSEPGGSITLRCEMNNREAIVTVADAGYGIPEERLADVFEMFNQVPEHRALVGGGGLGIGLALSRQLVEMHGGSIAAMSSGLGRGSEFVVRLPVARREQFAHLGQPLPSMDAGQAAGRRVLIVDDNVDAADSTRLVLELQGHDVKAVHSGRAALGTIQSFAPDIVLLDIGLPRMDGVEVARRIRAMPNGSAFTLVALTGWGQEEDKRRTSAAGFDAHLTKPVDPKVLASVLDEAAGLRHH